jgi:hypothetical protein
MENTFELTLTLAEKAQLLRAMQSLKESKEEALAKALTAFVGLPHVSFQPRDFGLIEIEILILELESLKAVDGKQSGYQKSFTFDQMMQCIQALESFLEKQTQAFSEVLKALPKNSSSSYKRFDFGLDDLEALLRRFHYTLAD